jgi:hypothetical protein
MTCFNCLRNCEIIVTTETIKSYRKEAAEDRIEYIAKRSCGCDDTYGDSETEAKLALSSLMAQEAAKVFLNLLYAETSNRGGISAQKVLSNTKDTFNALNTTIKMEGTICTL